MNQHETSSTFTPEFSEHFADAVALFNKAMALSVEDTMPALIVSRSCLESLLRQFYSTLPEHAVSQLKQHGFVFSNQQLLHNAIKALQWLGFDEDEIAVLNAIRVAGNAAAHADCHLPLVDPRDSLEACMKIFEKRCSSV